MTGKLIVAGVSIGNLDDTPIRTLRALAESDIIVTEMEEATRQLMDFFEVKSDSVIVEYLPSFNELGINNSQYIIDNIISDLVSGKVVTLVSTEGMPLIHDPGYEIVRAARNNRISITTIPGPSAPIAALNVSGLDPWKFSFESDMPIDSIQKEKALLKVRTLDRVSIFFEHIDNLEDTLSSAIRVISSKRPGSLCIDLTTPNEKVINGSLSEILEWYLANKEWYSNQEHTGITLIICGTNYEGYQHENFY